MVGLFPSWPAFFGIYLNCILIALSATGYGYMISALAPTVEKRFKINTYNEGPFFAPKK